MIIQIREKLDFSHIQLDPRTYPLDGRPIPSSREQIDLRVDGRVPIIVANMDSIGNFKIARELEKYGLMVAILKEFTPEDWKRELGDGSITPHRLIPTVGLRNIDDEIRSTREILKAFPTIDIVCLDVANGYLHAAADAVKKMKDAFPDVKVCAGNIVNTDGFYHLHKAGADIIKVGIGSGSVCLTRKMTGVGCPQFSAIQDLYAASRDTGKLLISDGGVTNSGDAMKAFAAGAHFVMMGGYWAGHDETGTTFHGMSSHRSRTVRGQEKASYRASEGREVTLASRGSIHNTAQEFLGGLASSCTYLGLRNLGEIYNANIVASRVYQQLNRVEGVVSEN